MVWCGVVWCGVVWCCVVLCGVVWFSLVGRGEVWCGVVWCGLVWCGVVVSRPVHSSLENWKKVVPKGVFSFRFRALCFKVVFWTASAVAPMVQFLATKNVTNYSLCFYHSRSSFHTASPSRSTKASNHCDMLATPRLAPKKRCARATCKRAANGNAHWQCERTPSSLL